MSAKSKVLFPSTVETLTTVTHLAGIQHANGNLMVYGGTCPGRQFNGNKVFKLKIRGLRSPFLMIRYRIVLGPNSSDYPNNHYYKFFEHFGPGEENPGGVAAKYIRKWPVKVGTAVDTLDKEDIHVHQLSYGIGGTNPTLVVRDPTVIYMNFNIETTNGTENGNHIRNLLVCGFSGYDRTKTGENVPLRVKQGDSFVEDFVYTNKGLLGGLSS